MPRRTFDYSRPKGPEVIDFRTGKPVPAGSVPVLCERIRHFREARSIGQKELAAALGVTGNAVCNWESGRTRPDVNLLPRICEALGVSLYSLYDLPEPGRKLTQEEKSLLSAYRELSGAYRGALLRVSESLLQSQRLEERPDLRRLILCDKALAAGFGDPSEIEESGDPIYLYASSTVDRADYVFRVSGDSMEPAYSRGDLVLVQALPGGPELQYGEVGAFSVDNELFIKVYEENGLRSISPAYPLMDFSEAERTVYLIGRVVGTIDPSQDIATEEDLERYLAAEE